MAKKQAPLFDAAEYLDNPEAIAGYLSEALKGGDERLITKAIGDVARAQDIARRSAALIEREKCRRAIREWHGLTEDEKRIAIMAIDALDHRP